ncbi:hypothetical protein BJ138DRAFT_1012460 [Hygrophoropsis aurantiaca]|uniref:Uncharacterized protein n=1 Tax=Hygrophoropsis aurantiaca TaxID=72124 RepID=A0ACB8A7B6_9AGAM|nr:hypothetical protein BJ138DRAFT_1012460 [Hygrophoropsis aurantiaca]
MDKTLESLSTQLYTLPTSKRYLKLATFWLSLSPEQRVLLQHAVKPVGDDLPFGLIAQDVMIFLQVSKSVEWALDALKTFSHKEIVLAAIRIIASTWKENALKLTEAMGRNEINTLVQLINIELPQYATAHLFHYLSKSPLTESHFQLVDGILKAIFPFLSPDSSAPLSRFARLSLSSLFTAASRPVLLSIVAQCAVQWFDQRTWKCLAKRRPDVMQDILLNYLGGPGIGFTLDHPEQFFAQLGTLIRQPNSGAFINEFLSKYETYTTNNYANGVHREDISMEVLAQHVAYLLRKRTDPAQICDVAISWCAVLARIGCAYRQQRWGWSAAQPLLDIAIQQFGQSPEEWKLISATEALALSNECAPTRLLLALFGHLEYNDETWWEDALRKALRRLPRPARCPFLNFLHIANTGEDLLQVPPTPSLVPNVSPELVALLDHDHHARFLDVGMKSRDDPLDSAEPADIGKVLRCLPAGRVVPGVITMKLRAMQVGATRTAYRLHGQAPHQDEQALKNDIEALKQLASRSSKESRASLVNAALSISIVAQAPSVFIDTLSWAAKRYAKDPDTFNVLAWFMGCSWTLQDENDPYVRFIAAPSGLFTCKRTKGMLTLDILRAWCEITNQFFGIMISLLRVWVGEPGHQDAIDTHYQSLIKLLLRVIQKRCDIINDLYLTLFDDVHELTGALLTPLVDLWMRWEQLRIVEYPEFLNFDDIPCIVQEYLEVKIHRRVLPGILPFIEAIGSQREAFYFAHRPSHTEQSESDIVERRTQLRSSSPRHFLPFKLKLIGGEKTSEGPLALCGPLWDYVERVLFKESQSSLYEYPDKFDWHPLQFSAALETYMDLFEGSKASKAQKLLFAHCPTTLPYNLTTMLILRSPSIQPLLWRNEKLSEFMTSLLPPCTPNANSFTLNDFNPLTLAPSITPSSVGETSQLAVLRTDDMSLTQLMDVLIPKSPLQATSLQNAHRFALFAVAFVLTLLDVPRPESGTFSSGIVNYALHSTRVSRSFIDNVKNNYYPSLPTTCCKLMSFALHTLPISDIKALLVIILSVRESPYCRVVQASMLSLVRRFAFPGLGWQEMRQIFEDVDASSWHRQALGITFFVAYKWTDARDHLSRILSYSQERYALQRSRPQNVSTEGSDSLASDASVQGPMIKMTTQKLLLQLITPLYKRGVLDTTDITGYAQSGLLEVPAAIVSYAVEICAEVALSKSITNEKDDSAWSLLLPFVDIAQRLDERCPLPTDAWDLARTNAGPMPAISEEHPVASALLSYGFKNMCPAIKKAWARSIVAPILAGHLAGRTTWLKCAVSRESGPVDLQQSIEASYGNGIPFSNTVANFAAYVEPEVWETLAKNIVGYTSRDMCQQLRDLVAANHGKGWESSPYGRALLSLTSFAIEEGFSNSGLRDLIRVVQGIEIPHPVRQSATQALLNAGFIMLSPQNIRKPFTRRPGRPFRPFRTLLDILVSNNDKQTEHVLESYLMKAREHESILSKDKFRGGACYWQLIATLMLLLARYRAEGCARDTLSPGAMYAESIGGIATHISENGWYHANFPNEHRSFFKVKLPPNEIVTASRELTRAPLCPTEAGHARSLFLAAAAEVLQANISDIRSSASGTRGLEELMSEWESASDGALVWLAMSLE